MKVSGCRRFPSLLWLWTYQISRSSSGGNRTLSDLIFGLSHRVNMGRFSRGKFFSIFASAQYDSTWRLMWLHRLGDSFALRFWKGAVQRGLSPRPSVFYKGRI